MFKILKINHSKFNQNSKLIIQNSRKYESNLIKRNKGFRSHW
jgi:hypothetical protein